MEQDSYINDEKILYDIHKKCKIRQEKLWLYYCNCLLKLHHIFKKAEYTKMLFYIKQIMAPVFPLVVKYFNNRFEAYCRCMDEKEKIKICEDVENSTVTFLEAYDALLQSIKDSDWVQFQPSQINIKIRYGAPKFCAYYTALLNNLVDLFQDPTEREYGFCVYPALDSHPEAAVIFSTFRERGKVGVIRVPNKDIADICYLRKLLLHESFHVCPGSEIRCRKARSEHYRKIIHIEMANRVLDGINVEHEIRDKLEQCIFSETEEKLKKRYEQIEENDRIFYSNEIMTDYANSYTNCILEMLARNATEIFEIVYGKIIHYDSAEFVAKMDKIEEYRNRINENIINILVTSFVPKICRFHMDIFREVFADLLTLLTLKSLPDEWYSVFHYYPLDSQDLYNNPSIYFRASLICRMMSESSPTALDSSLFKKWEEWKEQLESGKMGGGFNDGIRHYILLFDSPDNKIETQPFISGVTKGENQTKIKVLSDVKIWKNYIDYFRQCRECFLLYESDHPEFEEFRNRFFIREDVTNDDLLNKISKRAWEIYSV